MLERVLENWLNSTDERGYQVPLCQALTQRGMTVIHSTRHCALEMGKDLIVEDAAGAIHVYQLKALKGKRLTLSEWRDDLAKQVYPLAFGKVQHPAIGAGRELHQAHIVITGDLNEEVSVEITQINETLKKLGRPEIGVVVKGQLHRWFMDLMPHFGPVEPATAHAFLEIFLLSGREMLPKGQLAKLLEGCLPIVDAMKESDFTEACASLAVTCSAAISKFVAAENHVAIAEAWTIYLATIFRVAEKFDISDKAVRSLKDVALAAIYDALKRLAEELSARENFFEGDPLVDCLFVPARLNRLIGLMSVFRIWDRLLGSPDTATSDQAVKFCQREMGNGSHWGETSVIHGILFYMMLVAEGHKDAPEVVKGLTGMLIKTNHPESQDALASPYYEEEDILPHLLGVADEPLGDSFGGDSFAIGPLLSLLALEGQRDYMEMIWPHCTKITHKGFEVDDPSDFYRWRAEAGRNTTVVPVRTQSWKAMVAESQVASTRFAPRLLKTEPQFALLFLATFPHRASRDFVSWLRMTVVGGNPVAASPSTKVSKKNSGPNTAQLSKKPASPQTTQPPTPTPKKGSTNAVRKGNRSPSK